MLSGIIANEEEIRITAAGREFHLATADFPAPTNPYDRVDVEQQIEALIQAVFPDLFVRIHIYNLEYFRYTIATSAEDIAPDWWLRY